MPASRAIQLVSPAGEQGQGQQQIASSQQLPMADQRELVRDLLRFCGEVEVLSPSDLRQSVIAVMQAGLKRHEAETSVAQPVSQ